MTFSKKFREKILLLMMVDNQFAKRFSTRMLPEMFEDRAEALMCRIMVDHYQEWDHCVTPDLFEQSVADRFSSGEISQDDVRTIMRLQKSVLAMSPSNAASISNRLNKFIVAQNVKKAIGDIAGMYDKGDYGSMLSTLQKAIHSSSVIADDRSDYFEDCGRRSLWRKVGYDPRRPIKTLLQDLDAILRGGGADRGGSSIVMSPYNYGKTAFAVHLGKAGILQRVNTAHISTEDLRDNVCDRYDKAFSLSTSGDLVLKPSLIARTIQRIGYLTKAKLFVERIRSGICTVADIQSYVRVLRSEGYPIELLIIDTPDLLSGKKGFYKEERHRLAEIYWDCAELAHEEDLVLWATTWANREAIDKYVVKGQHTAESIVKMNSASLAISINRTEEEWNQNVGRIFVMKQKNGKARLELPITYDMDKCVFRSCGPAQPLPMSQGRKVQ